MTPGFYLVYVPAGYYPLVQAAWVRPDGADLVLFGARTIVNTSIGPEWPRLAYEGPETATLHAAAKVIGRVPRSCVVWELNMDNWAGYLPEAVAISRGESSADDPPTTRKRRKKA